MSKEYAMDNIISDKLDVFSFGAMILEIITGRQNLKFCNSHPGDSLLDLVRLIIYQYKIDFIFNICIWEELLEVILKRITYNKIKDNVLTNFVTGMENMV